MTNGLIVHTVATAILYCQFVRVHHCLTWYVVISTQLIFACTQTLEIVRNGSTLGLDIMGGSDRPTHIFRPGDKPGLFVLAVSALSIFTPSLKHFSVRLYLVV